MDETCGFNVDMAGSLCFKGYGSSVHVAVDILMPFFPSVGCICSVGFWNEE